MRRENWEGHGFTRCRKIRVETGLDPFSDCPIIFVRGGFGKGTSLEGAEKRCFFRFSALRWGCARARAPRSPFISSFPTAPEHTSARALHRRYQLHHPHQV